MVVGISSMMEKYSPQMQIARVVDKTVDIYEDPEKYINGVKELYGKASYAAGHPKETINAVGETIKAVGSDLEKYFDEIKDDPYKRGMLKGRATMFVASMFVGGGEAKVASKAGKGEEVLKIASKVEKEAEILKDVNKGRNIRIDTEYEKLKERIYAHIAESRKGREVSTYSEFLKKEKSIIGQIETKARVNANVIESQKGTKLSRYQEFIKEEKKIIDNLRKTEGGTKADDAIRNIVDTKGLRNDLPLTKEQIEEVVEYSKKIGFPEDKIFVADNVNTSNTGMMYDEYLIINNDVFPSTMSTNNPNSLISAKGTIAHEVIGHYETALKKTAFDQYDLINNIPVRNVYNTALDEAQASIRAARFAPDLTISERYTLLRDAINRLKKADLKIKDVRDLLDILER